VFFGEVGIRFFWEIDPRLRFENRIVIDPAHHFNRDRDRV